MFFQLNIGKHGINRLIKLLQTNGAPCAKKYVLKYVSEEESTLLYAAFSEDILDLNRIIEALLLEAKQGYKLRQRFSKLTEAFFSFIGYRL